MRAANDHPEPHPREPDDDAAPTTDPGAQADEPAGLRRLGLPPLTPDQERAVTALLTEATVAKAAVAAGVSERSIYRWLREDEAFQRAYREARRDAFGAAAGVAQRLAPNALVVLARIMNDLNASHSARVAAAMGVLKFGRDAIELDDVLARLETVEQSVRALPKRV